MSIRLLKQPMFTFFYRPIDRVFKPKISKSQYKQWQKEMGGELNKTTKKITKGKFKIKCHEN